MNRSVPVGDIRALGDRALLVGVEDAAAARRLGRDLHALGDAGVAEVVCGIATVLVEVIEPAIPLENVRDAIVSALAGEDGTDEHDDAGGRTVTIRCAFDGPDLDEVAGSVGWTPAEVVVRLTETPLTVSVIGFSPGFAYLDGLPAALGRVPRRATPRPVVPAGSVALANGHAAIYPSTSPGGWNLVGRTDFNFFSPATPPYAALRPGDRVQLVDAGTDAIGPVSPAEMPAWSPPGGTRMVFEVEAPGLRAVLQDTGRRGVAAVGVPWAGPADPVSFVLANALVGNPVGAPALEITAGTTRLRCVQPCHVAVVGGEPDVRVDHMLEPAGQVVPVRPGQLLEIGPLRRGLRSYLAVAGGLVGPEVFGSCASDELSGLGAGPVARGHPLYAGDWGPPLGDHLVAGTASEADPGRMPVALRVVPGPHPEWFVRDAVEELTAGEFVVDDRSNRIGLRLRLREGAGLRHREREGEGLDSQGAVTGAIQVPPGGDPVVLMPDHATLGGYPIVAVVITADHGLLGQCGPGTTVRFVPVDQSEAVEALGALGRNVERAVIGHYPLAVE